ncbi:Exonuclease SbcD [hydrothermal vent metagenome]|uniref:Nuclease SbcCD subunit D n=1 Tax=hydrothermal vent metagenome TaxID=652676 RepID=A0A1W1EI42_9ZZZZ
MRILHTSDWHLGQNFKTHSREFEHKKFLDWLLAQIEDKNIDVLIVAGDIFDSSNPPNYALKMYHNFLAQIIKTNCRDVIIVAGNHDGVSTLEISKDLLKFLNIYVVALGEDIDEVIIKIERDNELKAIICAVPYLRDRVLRNANGNKTFSQMQNELRDGIKNYYQNIYNRAKELSCDVPIIATGHFTTTGANISQDSEREIYIGKLENVDSQILTSFDYVAMGHIHKPQKISNRDNMRYSGSPIPLSFSESNNQKSVVIVEFEDSKRVVSILEIPTFKKLYRIKDSFENIKKRIEDIADKSNPPFVEIIVKDSDILNFDINELIRTSNGVEILTFQREHKIEDRVLDMQDKNITLQELNPLDVFRERLDTQKEIFSKDMQKSLENLYIEVLKECEDENN